MAEASTAPSSENKACASCGAAVPSGAEICPSCQAKVEKAPSGAAPAGTPTDLAVGETLQGQWKLESQIGQGGMGNVFLATELKLQRKVAVKALTVDHLQEETMKRFEREAQVMGKLDHPNIVTLYSVGRHRDVPFLVMRYLEGGSLWDLLDANGGRLTPEQLVPLLRQLCNALTYIHGKNLIHRDLKPSNIFISPQGKVTVLDLGLARGHTTALTRTGIIWGTPDYMAPEQILGEKQLDGRADLYSLGVVLYRMIANEPPFPDPDEQSLMRAHLTRPRPDITKAWSQASPALSLVLQKAMAIVPEERFQTADELAQAFERAALNRELPTRALSSSAPPTTAAEAQPASPSPARAAPHTAETTTPLGQPLPRAAVGQMDELDDDKTEAGELPPELQAVVAAAGASSPRAAGRPIEAVSTDTEAQPVAPRQQAPQTSAPLTPRPQVAPARPSAPVPVGSARHIPEPRPSRPRPGAVTAHDRPVRVAPPPPRAEPTSAQGDPGGTLTDEDSTGPEQERSSGPASGPMMVSTGDIEPLDDPKTEVAPAPAIPRPSRPQARTQVVTSTEAEATGILNPGDRVSPPTPSRSQPPRRATTSPPARRTPEPAPLPAGDEGPPWMHPYVLVTGGLLLLALGFLIGVLLR